MEERSDVVRELVGRRRLERVGKGLGIGNGGEYLFMPSLSALRWIGDLCHGRGP